ncbi:MAG: molybdate ABC transporter substrate-binding protein [Pirellulales bacterium]
MRRERFMAIDLALFSSLTTHWQRLGAWAPRTRRSTPFAWALVALISVVLAGCGDGGAARTNSSEPGETAATSEPVAAGSVTFSIAASTQDAVKEIASAFQEQTGTEVSINAASSSALANQIMSGAPVDLFLSANTKWADTVAETVPVAAHRLLLKNALVMIVPKGNPAEIHSPEDLKSEKVGHLALAGEKVPAGIYSRQALSKLGVLEALNESGKVATGHDVRVTLSHVERGEAEAGIVYSTDAALTDNVEVVYTFAPETHDAIEYPLLLLVNEEQNPAATKFFEFLASPEASATFERFGFGVVSDPEKT